MKCSTRKSLTVAIAVTVCLLCCTFSEAKKPPKPPGGGGGGGGTGSTRFSLIELPFNGTPIAISERSSGNLITVAVVAGDAGAGPASAAFTVVDAGTGDVLASGFLPEPPFVDPNDGLMKNGWSAAADVNVFGEIVGYAPTYDAEASGDPSPSRGLLWVDDGSGYTEILLPSLPGSAESRAFGVNTWGDVAGQSRQGTGDAADIAVLWTAGTLTPMNLNTAQTAAQGWALHSAHDISDVGLIVGHGLLNGVFRGYVMNLASGSIWPVPLIGPSTENAAVRLSSAGRVIGDAWGGDGDPYGTDPDYYRAYAWDGPGTSPLELPSLTLNTLVGGGGGGLNDFGAIVGNSVIPTDDPLGLPNWSVPTLWEFDEQGAVVATDLQTEIPGKPAYTLLGVSDINNDGWIAAQGRRRVKGTYQRQALLLVPAEN